MTLDDCSNAAQQQARRLAILVPIYQETLSGLEHFSLTHSLAALAPGRQVSFIAPDTLNAAFYTTNFPGVPLRRFDPVFFASIQGYNRLLLSPDFYSQFLPYDFMLILQTDALLLRDELDAWTASPYDYVGAPWPEGVEIFVNLDRYAGDFGQTVKARVGNGGLSLRRIKACLALLQEFPQALQYFTLSSSSEDLFFSIMGCLSQAFCLPNEWAAARFSLELGAAKYCAINGALPPMGGHAWWKYDPAFWLAQLAPAAAEEARALLAAGTS